MKKWLAIVAAIVPLTVATGFVDANEVRGADGRSAAHRAVPQMGFGTSPPVLSAKQAADATVNALPSGYAFETLQLNLCNSGVASCYAGGQSIAEGIAVIANESPSLVTLNEVCRSDVVDSIFPAFMHQNAGAWVFWAFMPAGNRSTGGAYQCKNGDQYGIGLVGLAFAPYDDPEPPLEAFGALYPESLQDTSSNEQRAWLCAKPNESYWGCTTHLAAGSNTTTLNQCTYLMSTVVPALWSSEGQLPSIVGGDLNLRYGGSPNVQDCVPSGWYRKGDGSVQHITVTNDLTFDSSKKIGMQYTDHPGWKITTITP